MKWSALILLYKRAKVDRRKLAVLLRMKKRLDGAYRDEMRENWTEEPFNLNRYSNKDCWRFFRFHKHDLNRLRLALHIPDQLVTATGDSCTGMEGLCLVLRRLSYPNRWIDLRSMFGRSQGSLTRIFYHTLRIIDTRWSHVLADFDQPWLTQEDLEVYSQTVLDKGGVFPGVVAFIDGTARAICRPKYHQKIMYSGHKRIHCTKWQSVLLPNGLIMNLHGGECGSMHDSRMFAESRFLENFRDLVNGLAEKYYIYGDSGYGRKDLLIKPFSSLEAEHNPQMRQANKAMSSVREAVEWGFKEVISHFAFVDFKKQMKIFEKPVNKIFRVAVLLTNCRNCMYPNEASQYFNLDPPVIEDYLT